MNALDGVDFIIHLAGANIGEKRWTERRKKEILESRIDSGVLLFNTILSMGINLKGFHFCFSIGISTVRETSQKIFNEHDPACR